MSRLRAHMHKAPGVAVFKHSLKVTQFNSCGIDKTQSAAAPASSSEVHHRDKWPSWLARHAAISSWKPLGLWLVSKQPRRLHFKRRIK